MKNLVIAAVLLAGGLAVWAPAALADDAGQALPTTISLYEPFPPQQDQPKPDAPAPEPAQESGPMSDLVDVEHVEIQLMGGILVFGSDFESDPKAVGTLSVRAPLPWLSRDVVGLESDDFGVFVQVSLSAIDRDTDPVAEEPDGVLFFAAAGLDYTLYQDEDFLARAQVGVQYGYFGDVTETDSGAGLLLGLDGGVVVGEGFRITLSPQLGIGDGGDILFFAQIGVNYSF